MTHSDHLLNLPADLPAPVDDGACDHLPELRLPPVSLRSTAGRDVVPADLDGRTVIYCYPRTGRPGEATPEGWDAIPGARGCTPQSCAFRDHHADLQALGAQVFGLSTQSSHYQQEAATRLHLPFELLSDESLAFARALRLPMFDFAGMTLIKRLTLIIRDGVIEHVMYPVFPPDRSAAEVIAWLREHPLEETR